MSKMRSVTFNVTIARQPQAVYDFVADLKNLPKWATAFCRSIKNEGDHWVLETPQGPMGMRITARNAFGILDHYVLLPQRGTYSAAPGIEVHVPMRVVANGEGSEVLFTLFRRTEMTDAQFAEDQRLVRQDLDTLKRVLEGKR